MMYQSRFSKKFKPAKKAWETFAYNLQTKFRDLKIPKTIKTTTARFLSFCSRRFFIPFKRRFLANPSSSSYPFSHRRSRHPYISHHYYHHLHHNYMNSSPIYIDNLYSGDHVAAEHVNNSKTVSFPAQAETSQRNNNNSNKGLVGEEADKKVNKPRKGKEDIFYSVEDAWNAVVARSPQLRGVDERADEFICKFREDMKIERERSILEFHEMLKRSS